MPYQIKQLAGKPYCPSNGTEGMIFMASFCDRCQFNTYDPDKGDCGCSIMAASMAYDIEDDEYPQEWTHNAEGVPTCTKFTPEEE